MWAPDLKLVPLRNTEVPPPVDPTLGEMPVRRSLGGGGVGVGGPGGSEEPHPKPVPRATATKTTSEYATKRFDMSLLLLFRVLRAAFDDESLPPRVSINSEPRR